MACLQLLLCGDDPCTEAGGSLEEQEGLTRSCGKPTALAVKAPDCPQKKPAKDLDTMGLWLLHTLLPQHSITHPSVFPQNRMQPELPGLHSWQWPSSAPQPSSTSPEEDVLPTPGAAVKGKKLHLPCLCGLGVSQSLYIAEFPSCSSRK